MPTIAKNNVHELYAELRPRLAADPLFSGSGNLEQMDRYMARLPNTVETLFGETLQGDAEAYRYAGVLLAAELVRRYAASQVFTHDGPLRVGDGDVLFYRGDLRVAGDLVLGDQAVVVVAGDLDVEGNVVGGAWDYSMLGVAGAMTARNVMTMGELLAGQRVTVSDAAYFYRNDYTAVAPAIRARVLVENDRLNAFGKISADEQIAELLGESRPERLQHAASLLGLGHVIGAEDLERELRRRLTVAVPA